MVEAMHPSPRAAGARVVQILGGIGNPGAEAARDAADAPAGESRCGGTATLLPGAWRGGIGRRAGACMLKDRYVQEATALFKSVTLALVGIGAVEPSKLLAASGNVFSPQRAEIAERARRRGRHLPALLRCGRRAGASRR